MRRWWIVLAVLGTAGLAAATRLRSNSAASSGAAAARDKNAPLPASSTRAHPKPSPIAAPINTSDGYDPAPYPARTTSGSIAAGNLDGRVESMAAWVKRDPNAVGARRALMDALLSRTQFYGTYDDFDRALALVKKPTAASSAEELDTWAAIESALHEFKAATDTLALAEKKDGKPRTAPLTTIHLALGSDLDGVLAERQKAAEGSQSFETLTALAVAQAAVGKYETADGTYRKALATYRDVSPFPVAWVEFQRGMMWAESAGRPDRAVPLYKDAIARLPGYVVASVHLSEIEADTGNKASAIERLSALAEKVQDPEPAAVLAKLYADDKPDEAVRYAAIAKRGYDSLLAKHRNAFLDHAAEFFGAAGKDPKRALSLAEENLKLRPTDRAYVLVIRAAVNAGDTKRACALVKEAGDARPSVPLKELRESVQKTCS